MSIEKMFDRRFVVLVGNYGSGKTEAALNLAMASAKSMSTTLVDLDIVNPYFRSGEKADMLRQAGIRVLMPTFALTTVDIPALPAEIQSVFETPSQRVIFDVGGDDTGAAALGRYAPSFARYREETQTALVVNCMRPLTQTAEDVAELAERIMARARMQVDMLINNTNLAELTTREQILRGEETVRAAAKLLGVHRVISLGLESVIEDIPDSAALRRYMAPEWMEDE